MKKVSLIIVVLSVFSCNLFVPRHVQEMNNAEFYSEKKIYGLWKIVGYKVIDPITREEITINRRDYNWDAQYPEDKVYYLFYAPEKFQDHEQKDFMIGLRFDEARIQQEKAKNNNYLGLYHFYDTYEKYESELMYSRNKVPALYNRLETDTSGGYLKLEKRVYQTKDDYIHFEYVNTNHLKKEMNFANIHGPTISDKNYQFPTSKVYDMNGKTYFDYSIESLDLNYEGRALAEPTGYKYTVDNTVFNEILRPYYEGLIKLKEQEFKLTPSSVRYLHPDRNNDYQNHDNYYNYAYSAMRVVFEKVADAHYYK